MIDVNQDKLGKMGRRVSQVSLDIVHRVLITFENGPSQYKLKLKNSKEITNWCFLRQASSFCLAPVMVILSIAFLTLK